MPKFSMHALITLSIKSDGKVRFSEEFQNTLVSTLHKCLSEHKDVTMHEITERTSTCITFTVSCKNFYAGLRVFTEDLRSRVTHLTEHGRDVEILDAVFSKYPHLRKHPRANEIVGAFDNLAAKVKEVESDTKSTPAQATPPLPKENPAKGKQNDKRALAADREAKLRGQGEEHGGKLPSSIASPPVNLTRGDGNLFSG